MTTLVLQCLSALLKAVFAWQSWRVSRGEPARDLPALTWGVVGVGFAIGAASSVVQVIWAMVAVRAGPGTPTYDVYLLWMPGMNYGRILVTVGIGVLLVFVSALGRRVPRRLLAATAGVSVAALVLGQLGGFAEGGYRHDLHTTRLALLDTVEMVTLAVALLVMLAARSADLWLWLALVVYTLRQAFNVMVMSAFGWRALLEAWHPPYWLMPAMGVAVWLVMVALAGWRLRLARDSARVGPAFEAGGRAFSTGIRAPARPGR